MNYDYSQIAAKAKKLIKKFGVPVTFVIGGGGAGINPVTGQPVEAGPGEVVTAYGVITQYKLNDIDGTLIKQGDHLLLCEALNPIPDTAQTATIAGVDWQVVGVSPVAPGGTPIIYKVQMRR